jgi:hypothetical protein
MRQFTIAAATVAVAAMISAAPASAEYLGGAPRKQNGQCWKGSKGSEGFGYWRACPQPASARGPKRINPVTGEPMNSDTRSGGGAYSGG